MAAAEEVSHCTLAALLHAPTDRGGRVSACLLHDTALECSIFCEAQPRLLFPAG